MDSVLTDNDEDGNGYIEYFEFKRRQESTRAETKHPPTPETPQPQS